MNRNFIDLIKTALNEVEPCFFKVKTTYNPQGIVRERVFCYELYHRIRLLMENNLEYINNIKFADLALHGEIDKRGHEGFNQGDRKNPDFVIHIPGCFEGNTIVIEVKGKISDDADIDKDFNTLFTFLRYQYQLGIFILYNHSLQELLRSKWGSHILQIKNNANSEHIHIITKKDFYTEPEEVILQQIEEPL